VDAGVAASRARRAAAGKADTATARERVGVWAWSDAVEHRASCGKVAWWVMGGGASVNGNTDGHADSNMDVHAEDGDARERPRQRKTRGRPGSRRQLSCWIEFER
jgi:hypothetical protein